MDLRFYNWERQLLCIVPRVQSANWYVYYNSVGTLEIHMDINAPQAKTILENKYLFAFSKKLQAVLVIKKIDKYELVLYGRTLNWFLGKRVVLPFEERSRNTIKELEKCIPEYMTMGNRPSAVTEKEEYIERISAEDAGTAVSGILSLVDLGHEVRCEKDSGGNVSYIFNVLEGKDTEIVLSEELKNVCELVYTDDALDYCSSGYYLKDDEWLKLDKDKLGGIYDFEGVLTSDNKADATNELRELRWKKVCEGKIRKLKYGEDYALGDTVTIKFKRGDFRYATKYRIAGVHIWHEGEDEGEEPIFEEVID